MREDQLQISLLINSKRGFQTRCLSASLTYLHVRLVQPENKCEILTILFIIGINGGGARVDASLKRFLEDNIPYATEEDFV